MTPDMVAAKAAEIAEAIRQKAAQEEHSSRQRLQRRRSKNHLQREERAKQAEEARYKSIASIHKQLARVLHPDLEQDEDRKLLKVRLMQNLRRPITIGDLHTLLRTELEWIQCEEGNFGPLDRRKTRHLQAGPQRTNRGSQSRYRPTSLSSALSANCGGRRTVRDPPSDRWPGGSAQPGPDHCRPGILPRPVS